MTTADPNDAAHISATCQFCEESVEIRWKCLNCDCFLCQLCSYRIHSKLKSNQTHQIINVKECGTVDAAESYQRADLDNMTCTKHEGQKCVSYCSDCCQTICFRCSREKEHLNHDLHEIKEVYRENIAKIKELKSDYEKTYSFFDKDEEKLNDLQLKVKNQHGQVRDQILQRDKELKDAVTQHTKSLLQKLDSIITPNEEKVKDGLKKVQQRKNEVRKWQSDLDKTLYSHKASDILKAKDIMKFKIPQREDVNILINKLLFIPGAELSLMLKNSFGELYEVPGFELTESFVTDLSDVTRLVHIKDKCTLLGSNFNRKLQKVKCENNSMSVINEEKIFIMDTCNLGNREVLLSAGRELKLYTKEGRIQPFKSFPCLSTLGVAINDRNEIIVGLTESDHINSVTTDTIVKVVVLADQPKEILHTYHYDGSKQRLFTWPYRIVTHKNKIGIVDRLKDSWGGRVVMMEYGGNILWVYSGCDTINNDTSEFTPFDIVMTSTDMVMVADMNNHSIHVLNLSGQVIACHRVGEMGVKYPLSLSINSHGSLWVGCSTSKNIKDEKAKIHVLEVVKIQL